MPPMKPKPAPAPQALSDSLSLTAAARRWGISLADLKTLLAEGELDFCQIAGQVRIPQAALQAYELTHDVPRRPAGLPTSKRRRRSSGPDN